MNNLTQEQIARIYDMYPESVRLRYTGDNNRDHEYNGLTRPNWRALRDSRAKNLDWKLLLRPLSAITEDEWMDIEDAIGLIIDVQGMNMVRDNFISDKCNERMGWPVINAALNELRRLGVDVDKCIQLGLAIDSTI